MIGLSWCTLARVCCEGMVVTMYNAAWVVAHTRCICAFPPTRALETPAHQVHQHNHPLAVGIQPCPNPLFGLLTQPTIHTTLQVALYKLKILFVIAPIVGILGVGHAICAVNAHATKQDALSQQPDAGTTSCNSQLSIPGVPCRSFPCFLCCGQAIPESVGNLQAPPRLPLLPLMSLVYYCLLPKRVV